MLDLFVYVLSKYFWLSWTQVRLRQSSLRPQQELNHSKWLVRLLAGRSDTSSYTIHTYIHTYDKFIEVICNKNRTRLNASTRRSSSAIRPTGRNIQSTVAQLIFIADVASINLSFIMNATKITPYHFIHTYVHRSCIISFICFFVYSTGPMPLHSQ